MIEEYGRRAKAQAILPVEGTALLLLYGLAASGQLRFWKFDGYQELDRVGQCVRVTMTQVSSDLKIVAVRVSMDADLEGDVIGRDATSLFN